LSGAQTQRRRREEDPSECRHLKRPTGGAGLVVRPRVGWVRPGEVSNGMMGTWVF